MNQALAALRHHVSGAIERGEKAAVVEVRDFAELFAKASLAGKQAGSNAIPAPMVVQQRADVLDDSSPVAKQWYVSEGVCGFAWVNVKPGNSSFARWLKSHGYASSDSYNGGVCIWIRDWNQSMQRKEAHAHAMAKVFQEAGIKAYAGSRMD